MSINKVPRISANILSLWCLGLKPLLLHVAGERDEKEEGKRKLLLFLGALKLRTDEQKKSSFANLPYDLLTQLSICLR